MKRLFSKTAAAALSTGLLGVIPFLTVQTPVRALAATADGGLTVEDVIKLAKAGLSEDIIIQQIKRKGHAFNLTTDQLIALKAANISDRIVEAMLDPAQADAPLTAARAARTSMPLPAPAAPPIVAAPPTDTALPTEVGVYAASHGAWTEVPPEIVYWRTTSALKTIATAGILHGNLNGHVMGVSSSTSLTAPLELLIVAPEGVALAEYQLIHLHASKDSREFRTVTGGVLHTQSGSFRDMVPFDGKKLAARVYQVTFPSSAGPGEYGVLPVTSNNGSGKIYSFRIAQ